MHHNMFPSTLSKHGQVSALESEVIEIPPQASKLNYSKNTNTKLNPNLSNFSHKSFPVCASSEYV